MAAKPTSPPASRRPSTPASRLRRSARPRPRSLDEQIAAAVAAAMKAQATREHHGEWHAEAARPTSIRAHQ